jgi:3-deoxy-D-manno-octulosonic-acid transferase
VAVPGLRTFYNCLGYCLAPFAFAVAWWRASRTGDDRRALRERFGFGEPLPAGSIWLHAVSVGEVQLAGALVRELRHRHPGRALLVTTTTPTGRRRALESLGAGVAVSYLPFDLPGAVARFLERARPALAVVLETELWPNLYLGCRRRGIPVLLANARLSPTSVRRYRRVRRLIAATLEGVTVAAQSAEDAARFVALGARPERVHDTGNIKFDVELPVGTQPSGAAFRAELGAARPVWVAGSTHAGEEEAVLDAHRRLQAAFPAALLVLAPRHPPRFGEVAALLERRGVSSLRRTAESAPSAAVEVLLLDTLGELVAFYAAGDVAFVGGSLVPVGGHNLLEPAAAGRPILTGPATFNAPAVAQRLAAAGALEIVAGADELAERLRVLFGDAAARTRAGAAGQAVIEANRGALGRVLERLESLLSAPRAT